MTTAFTFPGQGSQTPQMGDTWRGTPAWDAIVPSMSAASGIDIAYLLTSADQDELTLTANAQLSVLAVALMAWLTVRDETGIVPAAVAGHSLGEYAALVCGGVLSVQDAATLVAARGDAMAQACKVNPGTMSVVLGLDPGDVEQACSEVREHLDEQAWVANYNGASQTVVGGTVKGVALASDIAERAGAAQVIAIPVDGAFHTPLMQPAAERFNAHARSRTFGASDVIVYANVDGVPHSTSGDWPGLLTNQIVSPVQWTSILSGFAKSGIGRVVELGHGTTLTGIAKRSRLGFKVTSIGSPEAVAKLS